MAKTKKEEVKIEETIEAKTKKIKPLKDFVIHHNEFHYDLKKGEEIEVDAKFLPNLRTEKVIK